MADGQETVITFSQPALAPCPFPTPRGCRTLFLWSWLSAWLLPLRGNQHPACQARTLVEKKQPPTRKQLRGCFFRACNSVSSSGPQWPAFPHASVSQSSLQKVWSSPRQTPLFNNKGSSLGWGHPKEAESTCPRDKGPESQEPEAVTYKSHHESRDEAQHLPCRHEDLSG